VALCLSTRIGVFCHKIESVTYGNVNLLKMYPGIWFWSICVGYDA